MLQFPFGAPVLPRPPSATGPRRVYLLGAYPSGLHVRWTPPAPLKPVRALLVDNEPTPFWDGTGQDAHIAHWKDAVGWRDAWGTAVAPAEGVNGPSGAWVLPVSTM